MEISDQMISQNLNCSGGADDNLQMEANKLIEFAANMIIRAFDKSVNENAISELLLHLRNFTHATYEIVVALRTQPAPEYQWREQSSLMFVAKYLTVGKMENPIRGGDPENAKRFPGNLPNLIINNLSVCLQSANVLDRFLKEMCMSMYNNIVPIICALVTKYMTMCNHVNENS